MDELQRNAYAKINLGLDVIGRRPNGYHDVRMVMQTIRLYDKLTFKKTRTRGISIKSNLSFLPNDKNNLIWQAASLFYQSCGIEPGIHISLHKRIPVAAGLAGGSSDAAATLQALNKLYDTRLSSKELAELGVNIGADVPYCLMGGTALSEGIGEILTPLTPAPNIPCLIVKPPFSVSTKYVYENLALATAPHPDIDAMLSAIRTQDIYAITKHLGNTLESVTIPLHPEIREIKQTLSDLGADGTLMSGSGPTVFALFTNKKMAQTAYYKMKGGKYGKQTFLTEFCTPA